MCIRREDAAIVMKKDGYGRLGESGRRDNVAFVHAMFTDDIAHFSPSNILWIQDEKKSE